MRTAIKYIYKIFNSENKGKGVKKCLFVKNAEMKNHIPVRPALCADRYKLQQMMK